MNGVLEKFNKIFSKSKLFHKQICKTHVQTVSSDDRKIVLANHDFVVYWILTQKTMTSLCVSNSDDNEIIIQLCIKFDTQKNHDFIVLDTQRNHNFVKLKWNKKKKKLIDRSSTNEGD